MEMRLLSEGKLKKAPKKNVGNNDKLAKPWDDYKAGILRGINLLDGGARVVERK